ncbi:hypothetical protein [Kitasatospora sp. NBC_01266]|uniref:hypothetical protein n=1 Tax=Kitasatospora sp. NBC_01266 TaxID=2903572 RepID=UPI002E35D701|nr:hypothetical protein [Kitasatospora sp. NBC_01266]
MPSGDQFTFNGEIKNSVIGGSNNVQNNFTGAESSADAVRQAAQLIDLVQQESPELHTAAEAVHAELVRAAEQRVSPDCGRIRSWLDTIVLGLTAGSSALTLVQGIHQAIGG